MSGKKLTAGDVFRVASQRLRAGAYDEAERLFRLLLSKTEHPVPSYNLALTLLAKGAYDEGFRRYEDRRGVAPERFTLPPFPYPEWNGEPVGSLLVIGEQGFGDCLMFGRYVPVLRAKGIAVTVGTRPQLARLFEDLAPTLAFEGAVTVPRHEAWVLMGSLPRILGTTVETIPPAAYLRGGKGGGGIGFAWRGRIDPPNNASRSLPSASLPGRSLDPEDTGARDFAETAEIIRGLDLVISVDTAIAHLAGSIGVETWVLLTDDGPCWRWAGERSAWYPEVRLFRQGRDRDWGPVLDRVRAEARAFAGEA